MKKLLCLLILLASAGYSQTIDCKLQKSAVFKDEYRRSTIVSVDEDDKGGVVIARVYTGGLFNMPKGYYFEHYDSNMKLLKDYDYELKDGYVLGVVVDGDKVHIIEFAYDKKAKEYSCNASTASMKDFKFVTKELFSLKSDEVNNGISWFGGTGDSDTWASMVINSDKTAFGISIDLEGDSKNGEMHRVYVYDKSLNLKIDHTFKKSIKDRKFTVQGFDISQDGTTAYLLGKAKTKESGKKKEGGKYQYELTRITNSDSKTQVFDTKDHYAASLKAVFKKDRIACVGFYSDRNDSRFKGLCYFDLDPVTLDIKTSKFNPFSEQFMIDKYGKDKDKELKNVVFRDLFLTPANEIVFNAEEFYITVHYSSGANGGASTATYVYHYDDIVSAKLADNGDLIWARNINKRQSTGGASFDYVSYTSLTKGDETYFFINSGDKVSKLSNDRIQFNGRSAKRSNLNVIRISQNGDFDYKELIDDKDTEVPFMVGNGAVTKQGNSIYFIGRRGSKKQLLKISL